MLHIITPFSRYENKDFYLENLNNKNIIWHPIVHYSEDAKNTSWNPCRDKDKIDFKHSWVQSYLMDYVPSEIDICYYKLNHFIQNFKIEDNDVYWFMNDDDYIEDETINYFNQSNLEHDVYFVSMKRGYGQQPGYPNGHGTFTLMADPNRVIIGNIGLEQYFIKGHILKNLTFHLDRGCADGYMAIELHEKYGVKFLPDLYVLFNYLEKGRWEK